MDHHSENKTEWVTGNLDLSQPYKVLLAKCLAEQQRHTDLAPFQRYSLAALGLHRSRRTSPRLVDSDEAGDTPFRAGSADTTINRVDTDLDSRFVDLSDDDDYSTCSDSSYVVLTAKPPACEGDTQVTDTADGPHMMTVYIINSNIADLTWKLRTKLSAYEALQHQYKDRKMVQSDADARLSLTNDHINQGEAHSVYHHPVPQREITIAERSIAAIRDDLRKLRLARTHLRRNEMDKVSELLSQTDMDGRKANNPTAAVIAR